jgi:uncharacterized protein YjiS (DUF1127 family)
MQKLHWLFCCIAPRLALSKATKVKSIQRGMTMFESLKTRYASWKRYSRTVSELESLSNRELSDLGISRFDIPRLAREATRS